VHGTPSSKRSFSVNRSCSSRRSFSRPSFRARASSRVGPLNKPSTLTLYKSRRMIWWDSAAVLWAWAHLLHHPRVCQHGVKVRLIAAQGLSSTAIRDRAPGLWLLRCRRRRRFAAVKYLTAIKHLRQEMPARFEREYRPSPRFSVLGLIRALSPVVRGSSGGRHRGREHQGGRAVVRGKHGTADRSI
jgi:hypothetical protein